MEKYVKLSDVIKVINSATASSDDMSDFQKSLIEQMNKLEAQNVILPVVAVSISDIDWDTDGEDIDELPNAEIIPISELLHEGEMAENVEEELLDRAVDYLTDKYGFCIFGCDSSFCDIK